MNAIRTLPILNRPSRSSSPAPPSTSVTTATATAPGNVAVPGDAKARARSLSRQVTDKVAGLQINNMPPPAAPQATIHSSQPLGSSRKGPSPPTSRPSTPRNPTTPLLANGAPVESHPHSGYMDVLGLRLNENINKACAGVDWKAKKGFKKGQGWSVGEAVVKELPFPPSDAYLIRAVLRTAVRSLSIYTTRLESLLLPALTDSAFASPLHLLGHTTHPLNPAQYFAVSVAHAAWETCEVLEQTLETSSWPKFVNEALRPVMDKLDLVVGKVTQPLLMGLKRDLIASLNKTEGTSPSGGKPVGLASIPSPATPTVPIARDASSTGLSRLTKEPSDRGTARSLVIPVALQHFAARVDGARKVLEIVAAPCADDGEGWITGVVVATVWKGMCMTIENAGLHHHRPPSPGSVSKALHDLSKDHALTGVSGVTAKLTNGLNILPSRSSSRPPSPPRSKVHSTTHALMSLEGLVKRLVGGLVQPPSTGPINPNDTEHLAREALHEALEALTSLRTVSSAVHGPHGSARMMGSLKRVRDDIDDPLEEELDDAVEDLPAVTLFAILAVQANAALSILPVNEKADELRFRTPAEIWGMRKEEYDRTVLSGFGAAEDAGRRVAIALKAEVERVLLELGKHTQGGREYEIGVTGDKVGKEVREAETWVRAVGVAGEARAGIRAVGS